MSMYMTEEEQIESIKKWWKKYGNLITVAVSVVMLSIAGFRYWNWHQDKIKFQASTAYEQMIIAYANQDKKSVKAYANQLITQYNKTIYADSAHLIKAKMLVEANKLKEAQSELGAVIANSQMPAMKQVAKLRYARILATTNHYDQALDELTKVDDQAYLSVIYELKGDIYTETGKLQQAAENYRMAMNASKSSGLGNAFLEMKSNEIASLTDNFKRLEQKKQLAKA